MNGNLILSCPINQNGVFETEKKDIISDVYTLYIGNTEQNIYLENRPVTIHGFFDEKNPEQSSLSFTGIDPFLTLQNYMPTERDPDKATIPTSAKEKLTSAMASALAYLADVNDYPSNKMLLDMIPEQDRNSLSDLEFISVSLDDSEAKWRKMLDEEKLPWVMLWDKTGFPQNSKTPSAIQTAYGFYSIPFLVVIDKEGKLAARNVRGEQVREAILKIRQ